jgi:PKD repeat protein
MNPTHTYTQTGVYTATVTATNTAGSQQAATQVTVNPYFIINLPVIMR